MAEPDFCVTFEFLGLNEATSQASLGILIDATPSGWRLLKSLKRPQPALTLLVGSTGGLVGTTISFPLPSPKNYPSSASVSCKSSVSPSNLDLNALFRTTQSISTLGAPRSFPDDWYELNDTAMLSIPGAKVYSSLIMTSRDQDYSLSASVYQLGKHNNAGPNALEFTIRRPRLLVIYTYLVAAMPFLLLIAIFLLMHLRKRHGGEVPKHSEVAFGVAAALLAILPLRSVLVPSLLPIPTRLDLYLGLGAVGLVALSIVWVIFNPPSNSDGSGNPPEASGGGAKHMSGARPAEQQNPNGGSPAHTAPQVMPSAPGA
jgi:hypothetical protein